MITLFKHQIESIEFIRKNPRAVFDASDPGVGKTGVAIESFNERRMRGGGQALVLAPKSLLRAAWATDVRKFAPYLTVSLAYASNRIEAFQTGADLYITNHDAAVWLARQKKDFFEGFDTLIIDEVGAFKHRTSQRSRAIDKIKKYFKYRLVMNGTITPNTITDLWNQVNILDDGKRLGTSFFGFRSAVCTPKQIGPAANMVRWDDKPGAADAVSKLVEDIMIRHKFEDCIDIPDNYEYQVPYLLSPTQQRVYDAMEAAQVAVLNAQTIVSAVNAATVATKLLQISSGAVYEDSDHAHLVDTGRYELVLDLVEARPHTVVFFLWKHQRDYLVAEAKKRGITHCLLDGSVTDKDRSDAVDFFQKGMYRTMFAHPQSAAHGLTLTKGTATIWASPTYNLDFYLQGLKRIHRAGQTQKTETISIIATHTIEERVWQALQGKRLQMTELMEQLSVRTAPVLDATTRTVPAP